MLPGVGTRLASSDLSSATPVLSSWSAGVVCQCIRQFSNTNIAAWASGLSSTASSKALQAAPARPQNDAAQPSQATTSAPASTASPPSSSLKPHITPLQPSKQSTKASYIPWVYSRHLTPQRHVANRMGFLLESLEREQEAVARASKQHLDPFRSGDILEVRMRVPEAGREEYTFRGVCIARYNKGIRTAFKLLNTFPESGGVVQHLPLYMPDLLSVKVVGRVPARRSKLYYLIEQDGSPSYQAEPQLASMGEAGQKSRAGPTGAKGKAAKATKKKA